MTEIVKLIDYHLWATDRVTTQLLNLPDGIIIKEIGGSFPSIRLTLEHLLSADYLWMNRFRGTPHAKVPVAWGSLSELAATWHDVLLQLKTAATPWAHEPQKGFKFTTRSGTSYELPIQDIVQHMTHHGAYHRGQIANMLRIQGEKPVATDYLIFCGR